MMSMLSSTVAVEVHHKQKQLNSHTTPIKGMGRQDTLQLSPHCCESQDASQMLMKIEQMQNEMQNHMRVSVLKATPQ